MVDEKRIFKAKLIGKTISGAPSHNKTYVIISMTVF